MAPLLIDYLISLTTHPYNIKRWGDGGALAVAVRDAVGPARAAAAATAVTDCARPLGVVGGDFGHVLVGRTRANTHAVLDVARALVALVRLRTCAPEGGLAVGVAWQADALRTAPRACWALADALALVLGLQARPALPRPWPVAPIGPAQHGARRALLHHLLDGCVAANVTWQWGAVFAFCVRLLGDAANLGPHVGRSWALSHTRVGVGAGAGAGAGAISGAGAVPLVDGAVGAMVGLDVARLARGVALTAPTPNLWQAQFQH